MDIKERIKELCKKNGISMNALEKELGLGIGYISKLGKSTPNAKYLQKIADRFGVTTDYIMNGKEKDLSVEADILISVRNDKRLMQALKVYMTFSDKQKNLVLSTIENLGDLNND